MSGTSTQPEAPSPAPRRAAAVAAAKRHRGRRLTAAGVSLIAQGEPMVWLTGGALALSIVMIIGLLVLIIAQGAGTFWPVPICKVQLADGNVYMGYC